ncbi:hypothetical protein NDU88_003754 [Pleurodeles waltl]|uniref:Uncharacterized protein n=1 Tax=Pleurodeles waltl TaxID=8319 RepID=A0AAV7W319_PLEWA|nr:hypothetical protein NDU88_003754 [Pleurodeles waltl]
MERNVRRLEEQTSTSMQLVDGGACIVTKMDTPCEAKWGPLEVKVKATSGGRMERMEERTSLAAHITTILEAIRDTNMSLEPQITAVVSEVCLLRDDHEKLYD